MSSEEVAELAQAIHNHADALYESWTKGQEAMNMKRMEDTLELLADPGLTPKLEHLVSSFVRRDKAKRQFHQQPTPQQTRQKSPPKSSLDPQDIAQNEREPSPGSFGRKALPKSILAVVQRFEQPQQPQDITRERSPSQMFAPVASPLGNHQQHHENNNSVVDGGNKVNLGGIGPVTRNVIWAESSSNRQQVTERKQVGRMSSPVMGGVTPTASPSMSPVGNQSSGTSAKMFNSVQHNRSYSTSPGPGGGGGGDTGSGGLLKERHIPIERYEETSSISSNNTQLVKTNGYASSPNKPKNVPLVGISNNNSNTQALPQPQPEIHHHHLPIVLNSSPVPYKNEMRELEREEERLFHALRTGQLVHGTFVPTSNHSTSSENVPSVEVNSVSSSRAGGLPTSPSAGADVMSTSSSPNLSPTGSNNGYSRVAFAKERIRQSQQHPLTQQRLEFKNRLPSPSGSLAAAIAVQQGKLKFQPSSASSPSTSPNGPSSPLISHPLFSSVEDESAGSTNRENLPYTGGYHSRFNGFRFGPGSSVADRVQMFEKYPTSSITLQSPPHSPGGSSSSGSSTCSAPVSPSSSRLSQSTLEATNSIITSNIVAARKQQLQQQPLVASSSTQAPWRSSPGRESSLSVASSSPSNHHHHHHNINNANVNSLAVAPNTTAVTNGTNQQPFHHQHHPHQLFQIHIDTSASGIPKGQSSPKTPVGSPRGGSSKRPVVKDVPRFYFPEGKPVSPNIIQETLAKAEEEMKKSNGGRVAYADFSDLLSTVGIPIFWKKPFWMAMGLGPEDSLSAFTFIPFLRNLLADCPDDASRFIRLLSAAAKTAQSLTSSSSNNNNNTISSSNNNNSNSPSKYGGLAEVFKEDVKNIELAMSDFVPMIQDIIDTHQGLGFLRDAPEFHSRYITTVVSRVFYKVNRSWSGRITLSELRRSNLLRIIKRLEEETDINNVTEYFSYEHFYVIYCKFWELDKDHDLLIDKTDLRGHADHALSGRIIERIFSGTVLRGWDMTTSTRAPPDKMTYSDFVWFLLSEEDKKTQTSIEYWFRCLDLDGDGILSPFELQYFYCEQETRIEALGIEPLDFANVYCQIVDMLQCPSTGIRLKDFKRNPQLAANVFNTLFNLDKYLEHEQRDPFAAAASGANNHEGFEVESDWDKYAAAEYELLIAEETPSDHMHNSDLEEATSPT